jgi:phosphoglycerate dehydrogenase-like enzyme
MIHSVSNHPVIKSKLTILLLEPLHADAVKLMEMCDRVVMVEDQESAMRVARSENVVAILTRGKNRISRELMNACAQLKAVSRAGAGVDTIDIDAAKERDITIVFAPGVNASTTAEHTILLMLAITRKAFALMREVKAGNWATRNNYEGAELRGKTLGIVGYGAIGQCVARLAVAFGMQVIYTRRTMDDDRHRMGNERRTTMDELLREADIVSLHTPINAETRGLMNARAFGLMKRGAFLINTARGGLVDKQALREALDAERLAGFAGDVFDPQPPTQDDDALINHERVIVTPHSASLTDSTFREVSLFVTRNVIAVLNGETPETRSVYG